MESPLALTLVVGLVALGIAGLVVNGGFWFLLAYVFLWSATLLFIADPDQFVERIEAWLDLEFDADASRREPAETTAFDADLASDADPLLTLRERYAAGELDDDEFERMLDVLLSTETPVDAREHHEHLEYREYDGRRERDTVTERTAN
ncbi:hypothetical protein AUR64_05525 [Haloprofundus marisrubri]|uniref:SHOCT domain-containing protein n=2 Tax=Haloprofundus marisrubri TaxID=1514971 RepID=A0A0W1RD40_9EURY|nr:hypothetical protein AUR64_05525 [Haloprofundus marisrubri]